MLHTSGMGSQLCLLASVLVEETDPSGEENGFTFGLLILGDSGSGWGKGKINCKQKFLFHLCSV